MTDGPPSDLRASVSRETMEALAHYVDLLLAWNKTINLVSPTSVENIWTRHIGDCLQLIDIAPPDFRLWADMGSGGGLPGLVIAIASAEDASKAVALLESDRRKSVFLSKVISDLNLSAKVICERIESVAPMNADVVSARALAPLSGLLAYAERHLHPDGVCLFPKGRNASNELTAARQTWHMDVESYPSRTGDDACILKIGQISRV